MFVCWSHGKESGPWGSKIKALADAASEAGCAVDSVDYQGMMDPEDRVRKLLERCADIDRPLILAGSSMGGYVSVRAAQTLAPQGLFLLAPALYVPGYEPGEYHPGRTRIAVVHGWRDEILPPENSFRFARETGAELHLVDGDHRLRENVPELIRYFDILLKQVREANP